MKSDLSAQNCSPTFGAIFPRCIDYPGRAGAAGRVREAPDAGQVFPYSERHIQCAWAESGCRPPALKGAHDETVEIVSPGRWNLEAGPDFLDAVLEAGPQRRRLQGDVEVHVRPRDWERHGHGANPAYRRVVAHVTWYPGPRPASLPSEAVQLPLRTTLAADPRFSFENLDVTAYPYAVPTDDLSPCARALAGWDPADRGAMLDCSGEERLRVKTIRMAAAIREQGRDQAFYEECFSALGYKHNRAAFRSLARAVPLADLRAVSAENATIGYALLMGVAGLLPADASRRWDATTRRFVRSLWHRWWKLQDPWGEHALPAGTWRLSGLRPQNHPARRLAAAAGLFCARKHPVETLLEIEPCPAERLLRKLDNLFARPGGPGYWRQRLAWGRPPQPKPLALVGSARRAALLANIAVPFLAACGRPMTALLDTLPAGQPNALTRETAHRLFGRDHDPALYRTGLRQQGLLQIFHDFCLTTRNACADCPLPAALADSSSTPDTRRPTLSP